MLIIKTQGRLGNQLFQYAFARNLNKKLYNNKEEIVINYGKSKHARKNLLCEDNPFNTDKLRVEKLKLNIIQKMVFWPYLTFKYIFKTTNDAKFQKFLNYFGIYFLQDDIVKNIDFKKSKMKNKVIYGYFASEKYFDNVIDEIKESFKFNVALDNDNKQFLKDIQNSNAVCLAIRRGDYVNNDYFYVCGPNYYYDAIEQAKKDIKNPMFVVFSDDIKWVRENMKLPKNTKYENQNNDVFTTLLLMINCKHYIISNSTFHWWAQYLSKNEKDKIVYAPSIWCSKDTDADSLIYQSNWKKIKIKR